MRDVAGSGEEHEDVLVDVLETAVDVVGELPDQFGPHVVFHAVEDQEFAQVVYVVERTLLLQLLRHVLLARHRTRLVGTQSLGDTQSVVYLVGLVAVFGREVLLHLHRLLLEIC